MIQEVKTIIHKYPITFFITTLCICSLFFDFAFDIKFNITKQPNLINSLLYIFAHANIFHLILNLWALWSFRPRLKTCIVAYIISLIVPLLPFIYMAQPTYGLSGFILACFARKYRSHRINPTRLILINLLFIPFPMFNWRIHLATFFLAYAYYAVEELFNKPNTK